MHVLAPRAVAHPYKVGSYLLGTLSIVIFVSCHGHHGFRSRNGCRLQRGQVQTVAAEPRDRASCHYWFQVRSSVRLFACFAGGIDSGKRVTGTTLQQRLMPSTVHMYARVVIVGAPDARAVLCTADRSYYITKEDTSNLRLLTTHADWSGPEQTTDKRTIQVAGAARFHYLVGPLTLW